MDLQVCLVCLEKWEHVVSQVQGDLQVCPVLQEYPELKEVQVQKETKDPSEHQARPDFPATKDPSDHQAQSVHSVLQAKLVPEESLDYQDCRDQTGLLVIQDSMVKLERREIKGHKDTRVRLDFRVLEELKVIKGREVHREKLV